MGRGGLLGMRGEGVGFLLLSRDRAALVSNGDGARGEERGTAVGIGNCYKGRSE